MKSKMHNVEARYYFQREKAQHESRIKIIVLSVISLYSILVTLGVAGAVFVEWWLR